MSADPFSSAAPPAAGRRTTGGTEARDGQAERDHLGRYLIPSLPADYREQFARQGYAVPAKSGSQPWTRATTFAKSISDTFTLSAWSQRMAVKGLATRPDLYALAAATPVDDKAGLDAIVEQAKDAAAVRARANLGTAVHGFTEIHDRGEDISSIPAPWTQDVAAWATALANHNLSAHPEYIERAVVNTRWSVAGTFDRIFRLVLEDGTTCWVIGDLKTGHDLRYGWNEIAIQLVIYALADAIYDWTRGVFLPLPAGLRTDIGVVVHLPAGSGEASVYRVKLGPAAEAADLCRKVREWRATRNLAELLSKIEPGDAELVDVVEPATIWTEPGTGAQDAPSAAVEPVAAEFPTEDQPAQTDALGGPLGPLAGPGERGCSVCRRKGHKRGSPKCLGDADPAKAGDEFCDGQCGGGGAVLKADQGPPRCIRCHKLAQAGRPVPESKSCDGRCEGSSPQLLLTDGHWSCARCGKPATAAVIEWQTGATVDETPAEKAEREAWENEPEPPAKPTTCSKVGCPTGWTAERVDGKATGRWVCPGCGLPGTEAQVRQMVAEATATPAPAKDRVPQHVEPGEVPDLPAADPTELEDGGDPFADAPMPAPKAKPRPPTPLERILAASSLGELAAIGRELAQAGQLTDTLKNAGKARRAELTEPAG